MERYFTKNGTEITPELAEQWAEPWERGEIPGTPGEIVVGRPRISPEELATVTFKLPESQVRELDALAACNQETRSQLLRSLVSEALARA